MPDTVGELIEQLTQIRIDYSQTPYLPNIPTPNSTVVATIVREVLERINS